MNPPRLLLPGMIAAAIILALVAIFRPDWLLP